MRYEIRNTREIIISPNYDDYEGDLNDFYDKLADYKNLKCFISMKETTDNGNLHYHIGVLWMDCPKPTTFRSWIQKHLGKSNTRWDWKYRIVKRESFWSYIFKDGNIDKEVNFDMKFYEEAKKWQKEDYKSTKKTRQKLYDELKELVIPCETCLQWSQPEGKFYFCKTDCIKAVIKYYNNNHKVYDEYRMRNLAKTLYYKGENETQLVEVLNWE